MNTRILLLILILSLISGCNFDSTFFPLDERPEATTDVNQERIVLTSGDGLRIDHILVKPAGTPKATIFAFHGSGSKAGNWAKLLNPLVENGYQVFLMEYRGFGDSEGEAGHESVLADASRAFQYLLGREDVKDKKLVLLGQSYGGQLAIRIASEFPDDIEALVIEGTFTSFKNIAVHSTPWIGKPFAWLVVSSPYNSASLIETIHVPTLIIHSREDDQVPFSMGKELYENAAGLKEFWAIKGEHTDALVDYPEEFVARVNKTAGFPHQDK